MDHPKGDEVGLDLSRQSLIHIAQELQMLTIFTKAEEISNKRDPNNFSNEDSGEMASNPLPTVIHHLPLVNFQNPSTKKKNDSIEKENNFENSSPVQKCGEINTPRSSSSVKQSDEVNAYISSVIAKMKVPKEVKRKRKRPVTNSSVSKIPRTECQTAGRRPLIARGMIAKCLRYPVSQNADAKRSIFKAAEEGDLELVRKLMLDTGPAVRFGWIKNTLLHTAAANNQCELVLYLLDLINPNVTNEDKQTPAHLAANEGNTQVLKILLLEKDFNPAKVNNLQETFRDSLSDPLFNAVMEDNAKKIDALLEIGAKSHHQASKFEAALFSRALSVPTAQLLARTIYGRRFLNLISWGKKLSPTA